MPYLHVIEAANEDLGNREDNNNRNIVELPNLTSRPHHYRNVDPFYRVYEGRLHLDYTSDWLAVLLDENRARMRDERRHFRLFVNSSTVQYLFTICLRLRLPQDVKYIALGLFNRFMCAHISDLYEMVTGQAGKTTGQKLQEWERIVTTVSRQIALRTVSCIQIASKAHSFHLGLNVQRVRVCLQSLGYAYTDDAIRKSELRVLIAVGFCIKMHQTPVVYVESFLGVIFQVNAHLSFNARAMWEYSLLILDCVFLNMDEFYKRIMVVVHGNRGEHVSKDRVLRIEADYALLAAGVVTTACICVHGRDFISSVVFTLQRLTNIPSDNIADVYTGIFQTIYDHNNSMLLDSRNSFSDNLSLRRAKAYRGGGLFNERCAVED